jgi:carbamate kinase
MKRNGKIALVALGGNFLLQPHEEGTIEEQETNARMVCGHLLSVIKSGYNLILSHGNGPQVGNLLIQNEASKQYAPPMPLDVLVAQTEGSIGYILQQEMLNHLRKNDIRQYVVTMITQVMVERRDPAFKNPTKPVGPFFTKEEAEKQKKNKKWKMVEDAGRGYRRVVPSPKPVKIIQRHMIRDLAGAGNVVIALGGGGVPMGKDENDFYVGIEAVIDKDRASALLANEVGAELFILLTAVEKVYLNFGKPNQKPLDVITVREAKKFLADGHFPPGSMGPKIECAIEYINGGGAEVIITEPQHLDDALAGKTGTRIVKSKKSLNIERGN